ncbi:pyrroline-5-carboxylate reductase [Paenibacillus baekrokdamisoli]|uniref:Pyrroline-5-carboxylate reductase n=1 Tax=Paenibacillus baekrokdamisoli TaxID=1712516 RepID=A0A3G9IUF1_9BACL|nr:pyrroline-5-carboxylate reductase [Paenibacillus baekrokdamisoli]MBB3067143.1 pyrroline-5-carboxylate reductase [Paenibacillus baekrokdamisoli]BBH19665.1 pyrroline-5-carboxylate reductase [Paenibacillus baekrokdamisoli]
MTQLSASGVMPEISSLRLCFYGAGSMAEAFVRGILDRGLTEPGQISVMNRQNVTRLDELTTRYGIRAAADDQSKLSTLHEADIIFLAMKPKDAATALKQLRGLIKPHQLLISLVAGLSIDTITALLNQQNAIIRTMPNTSSTIGLGATGISFSSSVTEAQRLLAEQLLQSIGLTAIVEEPLLDVVTGVSGSGPAYVYYLMEAMIEAGRGLGLSEDTARDLTIQTVLGAAHMVKATNENPADLRRKVTSPGGTTQAAIETLDSHHFSKAIITAIGRAAERAGEMGAEIERSAKS